MSDGTISAKYKCKHQTLNKHISLMLKIHNVQEKTKEKYDEKKKYYEKNLSRDEYGNRKRGRHKILHRHTHTHTRPHNSILLAHIFKILFCNDVYLAPGCCVHEFIQTDVPPRLLPFGMPSHHITSHHKWYTMEMKFVWAQCTRRHCDLTRSMSS